MPHAFRTSEEAARDVHDAAMYIAQENPNAALRFIDAYNQTCELLSDMPESGSLLRTNSDVLRDVRMFRVTDFNNTSGRI